MSADAATISKSARKRANQKARAAEGGEEAPAPAPAPAPKKAAEPVKAAAAEPKPKAKGKAKAAPEPAPAAPKAEAKAKAKGKAAPKAEAAPEPKAAAKPAAKAAGKAAAKPKAKKEDAEEEAPKKESQVHSVYEIDDGKGGDWETSTGLTKAQGKRQQKQEEKKAMEIQMKKQGIVEARGSQYIPGMAPVADQLAAGKAQPKAKGLQVAVISAAAAAANGAAPVAAASDNNTTATIKVPEAKIGRVVGPKGANVNLIKEKTGVKTIDMAGEICTLVGPADAVQQAEHAIRQLIEKGYMSLAYDDFEEEGVPVHPSIFPDLIGSKGVIIQQIKKEAKVEIDIPPVPKNGPAGKKYKVMLAGSKTAVTLGKEIINSIAMYGHHEVTHPGQVHEEMEVEEWRYRYLIGTKGSEMRHIQNNYKVKVNIPREHSACQNVVVVGEPRDVERAIKYIEKVMYESDQPKGRGAADQALDDGGDEGPVEDWMSAYMYKRK